MPLTLTIRNVDSDFKQVGETFSAICLENLEIEAIIQIFNRLQETALKSSSSVDPEVAVSSSSGQLIFTVQPSVIFYSNTANINQQNVPVSIEELPALLFPNSVPDFGTRSGSDSPVAVKVSAQLEILKLAALAVILLSTAITIYFASGYLGSDGYEGPQYEMIDASKILKGLKDDYCADFALQREDGELLVRIKPTGQLQVYLQEHDGELPDEPEEVLNYEFVVSNGAYAILLVEDQALVDLGEQSIVFFGNELPRLPETSPESELNTES